MPKPSQIANDIWQVGAQDPERKLFDALIPLPEGTSYNSYLIAGQDKTALIDTVDPTKTAVLLNKLNALAIKKLDYLVVNHAEQDHSGSIQDILERFPEAQVLTNAKCKDFIMAFLHIPEQRIQVVTEEDAIDLGSRTLTFHMAPWVHWPETMLTWLPEDKVLFSCDLFGSHLAGDDVFMTDSAQAYQGAKRYYGEIMMPFRNSIKKYIDKVRQLAPRLIAASHGPVYAEPERIIDAYAEWVDDSTANKIVVAYVSMHDSTRRMVEHFKATVERLGIPIHLVDLEKQDIGELVMHLVDARTLVLATPCVLAGPHPLAVSAAYLANALRPKIKNLAIFGSFGWAQRVPDQLQALLTIIKPEILKPVMVKGLPREDDYAKLDSLANDIASRHQQ